MLPSCHHHAFFCAIEGCITKELVFIENICKPTCDMLVYLSLCLIRLVIVFEMAVSIQLTLAWLLLAFLKILHGKKPASYSL